MITITHTRAEGTLVDGTSKGDGAAEILRGVTRSFRWSRSLGCWFLVQSRDRAAKTDYINTAAAKLREAGFEVEIDVDDTTAGRSRAEIEADAYERADARADRYAGYAENAADRRDAAWKRSDDLIGDTMGQPILVGHHSEKAHRNRLEKAHDATRRGLREDKKATYWSNRTDAAENYQAHRENIPRTLRRLEKLRADRRRVQRGIDDPRTSAEHREFLEAEATALDNDIAYWQAHVDRAEAAGFKIWRPEDFAKGDFAGIRGGHWVEVARVNKKSLTVPARLAAVGQSITRLADNPYSWTDTIPYDEVTGRKTAAEIDQMLAERRQQAPGTVA